MLESEHAGNLTAVREHTEELVEAAFDHSDPVLVEAPPGAGKTTSTLKFVSQLDTPITYLCGRTDLYYQAKEFFSDQDDVTAMILPSPHRDCPSFQEDEPGNEAKLKKLYNKGHSGRKIHYMERETARTPCMAGDEKCEYISNLNQIDEDIESIDVLIGHHSHSYRNWYVQDRIVILDEFNADAFLTRFPDPNSGITDSPSLIVPSLLETLQDSDADFPSETFQDLTDILVNRNNESAFQEAIEWFKSHGASRRDAEESDLIEPDTSFKYDDTHLIAPSLTFSLFCMKRLGAGIEMAPHPDEELEDAWEEAGMNPNTRVVRNRNTGTIHVLKPPNFSSAEQVIGLDGTPTPELWNLLLPPEDRFERLQAINRADFMTYIHSALNMSLFQIGNGTHPYAGGRVSDKDDQRFIAVHALENGRFPLISTKKALTKYNYQNLLTHHTTEIDDRTAANSESDNLEFPPKKACNFASLRSSNLFEEDTVGVVSGSPFPGDEIVRVWAGLCGEAVSPQGRGKNKTFGDFGDKIYQHLSHHQVVQAILRFGREESVIEEGGATVYVNTEMLPEWFKISQEVDIHTQDGHSAVMQVLNTKFAEAEREALSFLPASDIAEDEIDKNSSIEKLSKKRVRSILQDLVEEDFVIVRSDHGKGGANLYRWDDTNTVRRVNNKQAVVGENVVVIIGEV
jgi:hypothetical protein